MVCSTSMVRKQQYVNTQIYVEVIWTSYRSYDLSHKSDRFLYEFLDDGAKLAYVPVTLSKL